MRKVAYILFLSFWASAALAQQNCNIYLYQGDTTMYKACLMSEKTSGFYQFSKEYQTILDSAIAINPKFSWAYRHKSTAYLKSGEFVKWKQLIDKAVELEPKQHLGYRGWCRYQFFRDYKGAIADIERLKSLNNYDIGYSANGDYHLEIARAIYYDAVGQKSNAISIIENQLESPDYEAGTYDYLHLGVFYLDAKRYKEAITALEKQLQRNPIAEAHYYLAKVYAAQVKVDKEKESLLQAKGLLNEGYRMFDPYTQPYHKIYSIQVEEELAGM